SSQQPPDKNAGQPGAPKPPSQPRLTLPVTTLAGKSGDGKQSAPTEQKMEEAVTKQRDLLAEFEKIADELNRVLANLEGSTLVKRLKAASRMQYSIAGRVIDQVHDAFGLSATRAPEGAAKVIGELAEQEAKGMAVQFAPVVGQPAAAALDAQAAQYVQQFRPMFRPEYYFIRNTCGLNTDQRKQLARMGETAVKAAARSFVEAQQKMMRGGWRPGTEYPDPRKLIEQELSRVMSPLLTHDQESRYKAELEKRAASRKQVVIDNLVAKLDGDLVLTSDQRTRLVEALSANWKDAWGQSLEMLMNIDNFFPNVPDQVVAPILTDNQKEAWRRIPRNQNVFWGFSFGGVIRENDPLDDPELAEAQKEAEAKEKK